MAQNIKALRAQVKARQVAVSRKINRLEKQHDGLQLMGSRFDPRRETSRIDRYNTAQLQAQLARLNGFMDRRTQFVSGAHGVPMRKQEWERRVASLQRRANRAKRAMKNKYAGVFVDESGMTVAQRQATMDSDRKLAGNPAVQRPWTETNYEPKNVTGESSMRILEKALRKQIGKQYEADKIAEARKQAMQMLRGIKTVLPKRSNLRAGDEDVTYPELKRALNNLTNGQFAAMFFGSTFATALSLEYELTQALLSGKHKAFHNDLMTASAAEVVRQINWARDLELD